MNGKTFIVVACDRSDTADGTPTKLKECATREEARQWAIEDMREKCDEIAPNTPTVYDEGKLYFEDGDMSTQYGIIEAEGVPSPTVRRSEEIRAAERVLRDNGIEPDEVKTVLQAVGYALLAEELYPENAAI